MSASRLVKYDAARQALAEAHRVDEAKDLRDKALALAAYARQAKDRDMVTWATEIKLRAERRTGELLRETAASERRQTQGRPEKTSSRGDVFPKLEDLGISRNQSSDWQKLAAIPEGEFEKRLANAARDPATMTTAKLLAPIPKPMRHDPFEEEREVWASVSGWLGRVRDITPLKDLKRARPTGGALTALRKNFEDAETYIVGLKRLRSEGWL